MSPQEFTKGRAFSFSVTVKLRESNGKVWDRLEVPASFAINSSFIGQKTVKKYIFLVRCW
jgi:hypothetical protein